MAQKTKRASRQARHRRVRKKISGTPERPRLSVFRSAKHIYVQVIDDVHAVTLASVSTLSKDFRERAGDDKGRLAASQWAGQEIAKKSKDKGIGRAIFDRGGYKYHGRVKAVADAAREAGLKL